MIQVRGYAAKEAKASLTPFSFERRDLLDHDVMIDIPYRGICHTDIHQVKNEWGRSTCPMVPGKFLLANHLFLKYFNTT
jgi:uncharacterized zinc-type alcohol dehydrogenase-like protein